MQYLLQVDFCLRYSGLLIRRSTLQAFLDRIYTSFFEGCYLLQCGASQLWEVQYSLQDVLSAELPAQFAGCSRDSSLI